MTVTTGGSRLRFAPRRHLARRTAARIERPQPAAAPILSSPFLFLPSCQQTLPFLARARPRRAALHILCDPPPPSPPVASSLTPPQPSPPRAIRAQPASRPAQTLTLCLPPLHVFLPHMSWCFHFLSNRAITCRHLRAPLYPRRCKDITLQRHIDRPCAAWRQRQARHARARHGQGLTPLRPLPAAAAAPRKAAAALPLSVLQRSNKAPH